MDEGIGVNPSRTIGIINPHITIPKSGAEIQRIKFNQNINERIPPRNIGRFNLFTG